MRQPATHTVVPFNHKVESKMNLNYATVHDIIVAIEAKAHKEGLEGNSNRPPEPICYFSLLNHNYRVVDYRPEQPWIGDRADLVYIAIPEKALLPTRTIFHAGVVNGGACLSTSTYSHHSTAASIQGFHLVDKKHIRPIASSEALVFSFKNVEFRSEKIQTVATNTYATTYFPVAYQSLRESNLHIIHLLPIKPAIGAKVVERPQLTVDKVSCTRDSTGQRLCGCLRGDS